MKIIHASLLTCSNILGLLLLVSLASCELHAASTAKPHRHRHEQHRNRLRNAGIPETLPPLPSPVPLSVMGLKPEEPNSSWQDKSNKENKPKKGLKQYLPPSYLTLVYESLIASSQEAALGIGHPNHRPIVRALRPKKISRGTLGTSVLVFKLNRAEIGIFNSAKIIFTVKEEADINEGSHVTVNAHFRHRQEKQTKMIWKSPRFYEFDFSSFLKASFNSNEVEDEQYPLPLKVEVIIFKNNRRKQVSLNHVFELKQDKPFLFLQYQDNLPISRENTDSYEDDDLFMNTRKRRSLTAPPTEEPEGTQAPSTDHLGSTSAPSAENDIITQVSPSEEESQTPELVEPILSDPNLPLNGAERTEQGETVLADSITSSSSTTDNFEVEVRRSGQNRTGRSKSKKRGKYGRPLTRTSPVSSACQRYDWMVKPSDVGFPEVVYPVLLDLGFCAGSCPFPLENDAFNFTLHSYFVDMHRILKGVDIPDKLPHSSCVAVSYKELMVLVMEGSGYVMYIHQDGAVASCGCR